MQHPDNDYPQIRYLPPGTVNDNGNDLSGQPILEDAHRNVIAAPTAFLLHQRLHGRGESTVQVRGRMLLDLFRVLHDGRGGQGIALEEVNDNFLDVWRAHLIGDQFDSYGEPTGNRGIKPKTFNAHLALFLMFLDYAQKAEWVSNLIGESDEAAGIWFPVSITREDGVIDHDFFISTERDSERKLPKDDDFDLVEAALARGRKTKALVKRDRCICLCMRVCTLRRIEVIERLNVSSIPSAKRLKQFYAEAAENGSVLTIPITIKRAKKGGKRFVEFPPSLLVEIREYIDGPRKDLVARKRQHLGYKEPKQVFLSNRTGLPLRPQSLTNFYKAAAKEAAKNHTPSLGRVDLAKMNPHINRHKAITTITIERLRAGRSDEEAIRYAMDMAGHKSKATAAIYLHYAQDIAAEKSEKNRKIMKERDDQVKAATRRFDDEVQRVLDSNLDR